MPGGQVQPGKLAAPPWMIAAQPVLLPSPGPGAPSILVMPGPPVMWPGPAASGASPAFLQPGFLPLPLSQPTVPQALQRQTAVSQPPTSAPSALPSKQTDSLTCAPPAAQQTSLQPRTSCNREQAGNSIAFPATCAAVLPPGPATTEVSQDELADNALQGLAVLADAAIASQLAGSSARHSASASASSSSLSGQKRKVPEPSASCSGLRRSAVDLTARPDRPTAFSVWTRKVKPGLNRQLPSFGSFDGLGSFGEGSRDMQPPKESVLRPAARAAGNNSAGGRCYVGEFSIADAPASVERTGTLPMQRARIIS